MTISDFQKEIISEKELVKNLIHNPDRPQDFNEQLTLHVEKISSLRDQLSSAKADLNKILYLVYQ